MVGVESPVQLPPTFNPAQARKSASSIIISRTISCSNRNKNPNNKFHHFTLTPHYASIFTSVRRQNPNPAPFTAFVSNTSFNSPQPPPDYKPNQRLRIWGRYNAPRKVPDVQTLVKRFWKVAATYWFSDDKIQARWRLATVFALTLGTTGISVTFNFLGRDFYNALANKDQEQFTTQLYYLAGFAGGIPVSTLLRFLRYLF